MPITDLHQRVKVCHLAVKMDRKDGTRPIRDELLYVVRIDVEGNSDVFERQRGKRIAGVRLRF